MFYSRKIDAVARHRSLIFFFLFVTSSMAIAAKPLKDCEDFFLNIHQNILRHRETIATEEIPRQVPLGDGDTFSVFPVSKNYTPRMLKDKADSWGTWKRKSMVVGGHGGVVKNTKITVPKGINVYFFNGDNEMVLSTKYYEHMIELSTQEGASLKTILNQNIDHMRPGLTMDEMILAPEEYNPKAILDALRNKYAQGSEMSGIVPQVSFSKYLRNENIPDNPILLSDLLNVIQEQRKGQETHILLYTCRCKI